MNAGIKVRIWAAVPLHVQRVASLHCRPSMVATTAMPPKIPLWTGTTWGTPGTALALPESKDMAFPLERGIWRSLPPACPAHVRRCHTEPGHGRSPGTRRDVRQIAVTQAAAGGRMDDGPHFSVTRWKLPLSRPAPRQRLASPARMPRRRVTRERSGTAPASTGTQAHALESLTWHGLFQLDAVGIRFQFLRQNGGQERTDALPHLRTGDPKSNGVVKRDTNIWVGFKSPDWRSFHQLRYLKDKREARARGGSVPEERTARPFPAEFCFHARFTTAAR
jgi:hypothetical protein